MYFKEACPSVTAITTTALTDAAFSSVMTVTMTADTAVKCHYYISTFTFEASTSVDVFVLSGTDYVTVEGESATIVGTITGSELTLNSQDMYWSEELGDGKKSVEWTQWDVAKQSRSTTLLIDNISADTTYTCTFVVNDRKWTHLVKVLSDITDFTFKLLTVDTNYNVTFLISTVAAKK